MTARKTFIRRHAVVIAVLVCCVSAATVWKIGSPKWLATPIYSTVSPEGRYRLDVLRAFYLTSSNYGFARLFENRTGQLMCESGVEWLTGNGDISWVDSYSPKISVGMDIHFVLDTGGTKCTVLQMRHDDPPVGSWPSFESLTPLPPSSPK